MNKFICCFLSSKNANAKWDDLALLLLRLFVGLTMAFGHGLSKLPPPEQLVQGVTAMGFPAPTLFAWCAALAEFVGGILIAVGLLTRPAALSLAFTMFIAFFVVHGADAFNVKELSFLYMGASLVIMLIGAGKLSLDHVLFKKCKSKK